MCVCGGLLGEWHFSRMDLCGDTCSAQLILDTEPRLNMLVNYIIKDFNMKLMLEEQAAFLWVYSILEKYDCWYI